MRSIVMLELIRNPQGGVSSPVIPRGSEESTRRGAVPVIADLIRNPEGLGTDA